MTTTTNITSDAFRSKVSEIKGEVKKLMVGLDSVLDLCLAGWFSDGHVLLEDVPGAGKTTLAEALAATLDGGHSEFFQGAADRLPSEILGSEIVRRQTGEAYWKWGFIKPQGTEKPTNILLADEINRNAPKTQSALLGAMQGRKLSNSTTGEIVYLAEPFLTIATQNPVEQDGVYPLAEAVADRFAMKVRPELLTDKEFIDLIQRAAVFARNQAEAAKIRPVVTPADIIAMREFAQSLPMSQLVCVYIKNLCFAANPQRQHFKAWMPQEFSEGVIQAGPGNRCGLWLTACAKAKAAMRGSDRVEIEDVQSIAPYVMGHRIALYPHMKVSNGSNVEADIVKGLLLSVPTTDKMPVANARTFNEDDDLDFTAQVSAPKRRRFFGWF